MTNNMTVNFNNGTIEITKAFEKKASRYGTDEYNTLQNARRDYPSYRVVVRTASKRAHRDYLKGLDYDFMKKYIENHGTDDDMSEFIKMTVKSDDVISTKSYGVVKKWFLNKFEEVA